MIDLSIFCGRDESRPYLLQPFSFGEFSYATNGHVMVRVPRLPDVAEQTQKGKWDAPFEGLEQAAFSAPKFTLPKQPAQDTECEACDGRGFEHDCPDCECTCSACDGSGSEAAEANVSTSYEGAVFALRYVRRVLALPGIELAHVKASDAPLFFRFDGGAGALMPMRGESANHINVFGDHD